MDIFSLLKLLGGLGLFIYGMLTMGNALEKMAGEKLEKTLETVTGNIFKAIGIVLCSETDEDIARYSVLHDNDRLFASKYMLYMPTEEELREEIERQKTFFRLQHDNSPKEEV